MCVSLFKSLLNEKWNATHYPPSPEPSRPFSFVFGLEAARPPGYAPTIREQERDMDNFIENYWTKRLDDVKEALEANNFDARVVSDKAAALGLVRDEFLPQFQGGVISFGGSMTIGLSGIHGFVKAAEGITVLDTFDRSISLEDAYERRRQALLCDLFLTGTNAVTEDGWLVNLDMIGNRVGGLNFGPRKVVVVAGRNKIFPDLDSAMLHIKSYTAPANAMRLDKKTPCVTTGRCMDCKSPERICNIWTITEKSFPKARISVILVNQDLGL